MTTLVSSGEGIFKAGLCAFFYFNNLLPHGDWLRRGPRDALSPGRLWKAGLPGSSVGPQGPPRGPGHRVGTLGRGPGDGAPGEAEAL